MTMRIAVIAPGEMGSGVGGVLVRHGLTVLTSLQGRSADSAARAARFGLRDAPDAELAACDVVLSIMPPKDALGLAERLRPALQAARRKPVYVDCNAVAPETVQRIAAVIAPTGARFVDAGIIGPPPSEQARGITAFYACGDATQEFARLSEHGLTVRVMDGAVGAASALKMAYAGLTKGFTALCAAMILGASESGVADALRQELSESQPHFLAFLDRSVPAMFPKAYRWIAEMEEIAAFAQDVDGGAAMYQGAADLYRMIADQMTAEEKTQTALAALRGFCAGDK